MVKIKGGLLLFLVCAAYFVLFCPPNFTGAQNADMLLCAENANINNLGIYPSDEHIQYLHLSRMAMSATPLLKTLENIIVYRHWHYGYPFYLTSLAAIVPVKIFNKTFLPGGDLTSWYVLVLRQLSAVYMIGAIVLLIYLLNGFRFTISSAAIFLFLSSIPCVFGNNMWWHPDSLATLLTVLTIFSLCKDDLKLGTWFYIAGVFCGLAAGTKVIGIFLLPAVAIYIGISVRNLKGKYIIFIKKGLMFLGLVSVVIIISNPLLAVRGFAGEIIETLRIQSLKNTLGWEEQWLQNARIWYRESLSGSFGLWFTYLIACCFCIMGILYDSRKRIFYVLILCWAIPFSCYLLFFVTNTSGRYFIPVLLPLLSCVCSPSLWRVVRGSSTFKKPIAWLSMLIALFIAYQFVLYIRTDIATYTQMLNKEKESRAINFYTVLKKNYLEKISHSAPLIIYRDYYIYLPPQQEYVAYNNLWYPVGYEEITGINPDIIVLRKKEIKEQLDEMYRIIQIPAMASKRTEDFLAFYKDAHNASLKGFQKLYTTDYAIAFIRNNFSDVDCNPGTGGYQGKNVFRKTER